MKVSRVLFHLWLIPCGLVLTGCSTVVRPTVSQSEFLSSDAKIPMHIAFHVTDAFKGYSQTHVDWWCDATSYKMELGLFTTDWFRYALESKFTDVKVIAGPPTFPYPDSATDFIITPTFTSFKAGGPVVVKMENYWVELGMDVPIQDRNGEILDTLCLKEKGAKGGTAGFNPGVHIYPEACRLAVKPLADQTIEKLIALKNGN